MDVVARDNNKQDLLQGRMDGKTENTFNPAWVRDKHTHTYVTTKNK